ncbi:MAG: anhydro-N-acetylmuramic acid kinase, partial [Proteobacteria bacterium]|nr:anhydro-N-acetylmuramic acid kinase [Pseudomonadota bacterium]
GTDYFNQSWILEFFQKEMSNLDFLATVTELTAQSIAREINAINSEHEKVIVYGGGSHNTFLINRIRENLKNYDVVSSELIGLDPDYVEAIAFAWLAKERIKNKTIDLTQITGSRSIALLGECYL